ncbi:MAG TPA: PAS domain S-box protein [Micropepsaceae bacterium]|nr:PAS domain S-box protein [Micropepsaceae bacterium]
MNPVPSPGSPAAHQSLLERSPVAMAEVEGEQHLVRYANPAFCRLVRKSREALAGRPFAEAMRESHGCLGALDRAYRSGEAEVHTEAKPSGRQAGYLSCAVWPVLDEQQRPTGAMVQVTETAPAQTQTSAVNEALLISSVRQHERTGAAEKLNDQLRKEIDHRRRTEAALRESEERYRTLTSQVKDYAIFRTDIAGMAISWNEGVKEILGFRREEFIGQDVVGKIFTPEDLRAGIADRELRTAAAEGSASDDRWLRRKDGTRFFAQGVTVALKDSAGGLIGFTKIFRDMTRQKDAEDALRSSEARLTKELAAMRSLQEVSTLMTREGNLQTLHPRIVDAAMALMGSDAASIQMLDDGGSRLRLLAWRGFHPDSAKFWEFVGVEANSSCAIALAKQRRIVVPDVETSEAMAGTEDLKFYRRSGIRSVQSTPLVSRTGGLLGMISTHWQRVVRPSGDELLLFDVLARQTADLIERDQSDAAQRETREQLQRAFEFDQAIMASMSEGLYTKDRDGRLTSMNHAAEALFGWDFEELSGRDMHEMTHHHHPGGTAFPAAECRLMRVLETGEPLIGQEDEFVRKDGSFFPVTYSAAPVREGGAIAGLVVIFRDITERRRAQERERALATEISHRNKNLLTVIQAIVSRSLADKATPAQARVAVMQRLQAIAKSQTALESGGFVGASLDEITRLEFETFSDRIDASGPNVLLNPRAAQTFAMLLHELGTNAMKYGALSSPDGRVSAEWSVEGADAEAQFRFRWIERGGPRVAPRTRLGFGSVLIEKIVAQDFGTTPDINFAPEGLRYKIDLPLSALVPDPRPIDACRGRI